MDYETYYVTQAYNGIVETPPLSASNETVSIQEGKGITTTESKVFNRSKMKDVCCCNRRKRLKKMTLVREYIIETDDSHSESEESEANESTFSEESGDFEDQSEEGSTEKDQTDDDDSSATLESDTGNHDYESDDQDTEGAETSDESSYHSVGTGNEIKDTVAVLTRKPQSELTESNKLKRSKFDKLFN